MFNHDSMARRALKNTCLGMSLFTRHMVKCKDYTPDN